MLFTIPCELTISFSQNRTIDSLQQVFKKAKQDTTKVNLLNKISEEYDMSMELDNAIKYGNDALALAKKINFQFGVTKALDNLGNASCDKGDNQEALKYYSTSLSIKKGLGNKKEIAYTYNLIGYMTEDYDEALKNYEAALKLNTEIGYKVGMGKNYINIGLVYINKGDFTKALQNYLSAFNINEKLGSKKGMALDLRNIGECYRFQGNYPEALKSQLTSLKINEELNDKGGLISNGGF